MFNTCPRRVASVATTRMTRTLRPHFLADVRQIAGQSIDCSEQRVAATIYSYQENKVGNKHCSLMNLYAACELVARWGCRG